MTIFKYRPIASSTRRLSDIGTAWFAHQESNQYLLSSPRMVNSFYKNHRNAKPPKTSDPLDIAARYFVYKLYEATDGRRLERQLLREIGETQETVLRSVGLGWATLHDADGEPQKRSVALTEEGRKLARRGR